MVGKVCGVYGCVPNSYVSTSSIYLIVSLHMQMKLHYYLFMYSFIAQ